MVKNLPAMQEAQVWSLGQEDPLEKGMATHSSVLAWRIPWTEEPGRLQSMGLQRVGHSWETNTYWWHFSHSFLQKNILTPLCARHCPQYLQDMNKTMSQPSGSLQPKGKINNKQTNKGMSAGEQKNKAEKRDIRKQEQELFYMSSLSEKTTTKKRPEWSERVGQAATRKNPVICAAGLWSNVIENFHSAPRKMSAELPFQDMLVPLKQPICFYLKDTVNQVNNCENI